MWHFLMKVPYYLKLNVMYDMENKGFDHFSSNYSSVTNQSIASQPL